MSDFRVLLDVGRELRRVLLEGFQVGDAVTDKVSSDTHISLDSPAGLKEANDKDALLSLYLYQVRPNSHVNNVPWIPSGPRDQRHPPLGLDLSYLLTPVSTKAEDNLVLLGRAVQILAAHTTLRAGFLRSDLGTRSAEARLTLNPVSLEEMTRIWSAFSQPYRLSVCYQVQLVAIDTLRPPEEAPEVVESLVDVRQIVGAAP